MCVWIMYDYVIIYVVVKKVWKIYVLVFKFELFLVVYFI